MKYNPGVQVLTQTFSTDSGGNGTFSFGNVTGVLVRVSYINNLNSDSAWTLRIRDQDTNPIATTLGNTDSTIIPTLSVTGGVGTKEFISYDGVCSGSVTSFQANGSGTLRFYFLTDKANTRQFGGEN